MEDGIIVIFSIICVFFFFLICSLFAIKNDYKVLEYEEKNNRQICRKLYEKITNKKLSTSQKEYFYNTSKLLEECLNEIGLIKKRHKEEIKKIRNEIDNKIEEVRQEKSLDKLHSLIQTLVQKEEEDFDNLYVHLTCKDRPAYSSAQKVQEAKEKAKEFSIKYKLMKYEYNLLFDLFPELEGYLERYDENYCDIQNNTTLDDVKSDYDYSKKWLSQEEYENLGECERNQLALDRYIASRKKSNWQIGRDYEMFIGYEYSNRGYDVQYFGIEKKLEDMGRDVIAGNEKEILIIQCKYWSKEKIIHEKHICQLYGSAIQYEKQNKPQKQVIPVLITTTKLSDKALEFAEYLNVQVIQEKPFEEFPRIKCNISKNGEKIYHLPFDQQYDSTKIDKKGECYEFRVENAILKGFRRAKKWYP